MAQESLGTEVHKSQAIGEVSRDYFIKRAGRRLQRVFLPLLTAPEKLLFAHGILSPKKLCLPDFLGIGTPQSGTTWLYENLRCHPEIFLPARKELRYFDWHFYRSLRWDYARRFRTGRGKVKGEITPSYGRMPLERIRFIRKIMPDVKLILILRNPVDRMWAVARRVLARIPGKRLEDAKESEIVDIFRDNLQRGSTDYPAILANWWSIFPKEQLFVGFFEQISNEPQELLRRVFAFLDVSTDVNWKDFPYDQVINKNPEYPLPAKCREFLEKTYAQDIEELYARFGEPVRSWQCAGRTST